MVHVEDRGYQFGDAVYEVCEVRGGRLVDERRHLERLRRSLEALQIRLPMSHSALGIAAIVSAMASSISRSAVAWRGATTLFRHRTCRQAWW